MQYQVTIPIAGCVVKVVEANSMNAAKKIALEEEFDFDEIHEIEMYEKIAEGNCLHVAYNSIEIEQL